MTGISDQIIAELNESQRALIREFLEREAKRY